MGSRYKEANQRQRKQVRIITQTELWQADTRNLIRDRAMGSRYELPLRLSYGEAVTKNLIRYELSTKIKLWEADMN